LLGYGKVKSWKFIVVVLGRRGPVGVVFSPFSNSSTSSVIGPVFRSLRLSGVGRMGWRVDGGLLFVVQGSAPPIIQALAWVRHAQLSFLRLQSDLHVQIGTQIKELSYQEKIITGCALLNIASLFFFQMRKSTYF
jgi:hypothetical protein